MLLIIWCIFAVCVYVYVKRTYFTLRPELPGLSPHFLFGNLIQTGILSGRVSLPEALTTFKKRYGDIYQFWLGPSYTIIVNDVTDVQHIFSHRNIYDQGDFFIEKASVLFPDGLLCTKGAQFKRHAAVTYPLFRRGKFTSNLDLVIECVDQLLTKWLERPEGQVHTDIFHQLHKLMLAIFGFIAFDYDLQTLNEDHKTGSNELAEALEVINNSFQIVTYAPRWLSILYLKLSSRHRRAKKLVEHYIYRIIEQEMNESPESRAQRKRTSLIASLVESIPFNEKNEATKCEEEKTGLSRQEVLNEILFFLNAGSDTIATVITWFIHLVSKHPRVQEKIKAELIANDATGTLSLSHLDSLVYLDCTINEVLRFCPPVSGTMRTLTIDDRLPKSGIQLYKSDSVFISFHNLSHDPRYWSIDPEQFYPERFLGEDKNHPDYALIPFGSGHRHCIGEDFARFTLKVIMARLMQQVTFGDGGPKLNAGGHSSQVTIVPKKVGVTFTFF